MKKDKPWLISKKAMLASAFEVSAEKPGNVTPTKSFGNLCYGDFVGSAIALEDHIYGVASRAIEGKDLKIGKTIFEAFEANQRFFKERKNRNFGIILMFVPLAAAAANANGFKELRPELRKVLGGLSWEDTIWIYKAMRVVDLGGMKLNDAGLSELDVYNANVFDTIKNKKISPIDVFELSKDRDTLAGEWVNGYSLCFSFFERFKKKLESEKGNKTINDAIIETFVDIISEVPDTFISRKVGGEISTEVSERASDVVRSNYKKEKIQEFDSFLRTDQNRLNPGTSADLVATILFLYLLEG